jgi:uncharacterized protein (TIGR02186 family)
MMRRLVTAALVVVASAGAATAERLTIAASAPEVEIGSNFTGTTITVFGVIERDAAFYVTVPEYQVAIVLLGPPQTVVARRKDRVVGIWANRAAETIVAAPSFYALGTSVRPEELSRPAILDRLTIGFDNIDLRYQGRAAIDDPGAAEFRDAFIRLKQRARLYDEAVGVEFIGDTIFRASIRLPANIPVGRYAVLGYLFAGETLIARAEETIAVTKTGFEQFMSAFAIDQSLVYGLLCVTLAIFVGWLGGVIFRRD